MASGPACLMIISLLLLLQLTTCHPSVCEAEARKTASVFKECMDEILFVGDIMASYVQPTDKLQVYMEATFSLSDIFLDEEESVCCTLQFWLAMSKAINSLAFEPNPAILYYKPPVFEWQFVPDATITGDDMFTMMMVGISSWRTDYNIGFPDRPGLYWLVTDIKGFDYTTGKEVVTYNSPVTSDTFMILFYKQSRSPIADVPIAPYASFGEGCPIHFKNSCVFQVEQYAREQGLTLVGLTWFLVKADTYSSVFSINHLGKSPAQGCPLGYPELKPMADGYNINCNYGQRTTFVLLNLLLSLVMSVNL